MATNEPIWSHRLVRVGSDRNFGLVFAVVFAIIALAPFYRTGTVRWWAIAAGAAFLIAAFMAPRLLRATELVMVQVGAPVASHNQSNRHGRALFRRFRSDGIADVRLG